jgi:ribosome-associated translation inhibitor RaiA
MVTLILKNLKEVDSSFHKEIETIAKEKEDYYNERFKKYDKDLTLEVIFNKSSSLNKVSASLDLKSKKVLVAEEDKNPVMTLNKVFSSLKKAVKKQYELERKDYLYKRKR